jgi:uncharacterized protein YcbK (DUF882 family)
MKLTTNFKLSEFIKSNFFDKKSQELVIKEYNNNKDIQNNIQKLADNLQILRNKINKPININIAYRPLFWELKQGRNGNSQHTLGKAADIVVKGISTKELYNIIENLINSREMLQGGLGLYNNFIHYDIRKNKARW